VRRDTKYIPLDNYSFKISTCTKKFQSFQKLGVIYNDSRYMWFMVNMQIDWFNQNIKSLNDIKFEIKAKLWTCFNYIKIRENFIVNKFIVINFYGFQSLAHFNLHPICIHWNIAYKLDHFFFFFLFLLLSFLFPSCKTFMATSHSSSYEFNSIDDTCWKKVITLTTYS